MTPQPKTILSMPDAKRHRRRVVRRRIVAVRPVLVAAPAPLVSVPRHREETRISPNGTRFTVSVPLGTTGEPLTGEEVMANIRNRRFDAEILREVFANIATARNAPADAETEL